MPSLRTERNKPPMETLTVPKDLIIRADSLLSLLWHRYVPPDRKDTDLRYDVEQTIGALRQLTAETPHGTNTVTVTGTSAVGD